MPTILPFPVLGEQYRVSRSVAGRYAEVVGAASPGAAHERALRLEASWWQYLAVLRIANAREQLARIVTRTHDEAEAGEPPPFPQALLSDGHTDRAQDEAREQCLHDGASVAEIRVFITRTRREVGEKLIALRAAERQLVALGQDRP